MIDVNVHLGSWPFRRLPHDRTETLVAKMKSQGVVQAWAGSFDSVLHRDVAGVNARLVDECRLHGDGLLVPFGLVNLKMPDWEDDLRRCADHRMPGLRLYPGYHGYSLDDPAFIKLSRIAAQRRLIVQIVVSLEDERTQHPLVRAQNVDLRPLVALLKELGELPVVLMNAFHAVRLGSADLPALAEAGRLYFELATLEGVGGLESLVRRVRADRILFGSHFPFFCFESARLKVDESALAEPQKRAIIHENARGLMAQAAQTTSRDQETRP